MLEKYATLSTFRVSVAGDNCPMSFPITPHYFLSVVFPCVTERASQREGVCRLRGDMNRAPAANAFTQPQHDFGPFREHISAMFLNRLCCFSNQ